MDIVGL